MTDTLIPKKKYDGLTCFSTWLFGTGHVLNDLCSAAWFNYLLYFLVAVEDQSSAIAGYYLFSSVILIGHIVDGIFTPTVGFFSDKVDTKIGKRKPWYIFGTVLVPLGFFFLFQKCYPCEAAGSSRAVIAIFWYGFFAGIHNIGWAAVQISHLSLIPSLTPIKEKKNFLIGIRNGFTYISNTAVLIMAFILILIISDPRTQFSVLSAAIIAIGLTINILFILFFDEVSLAKIAHNNYRILNKINSTTGSKDHIEAQVRPKNSVKTENEDQEDENEKKMTWKSWIIEPQLYAVGAIYTVSRMSNNIATSMMPFYLTTVLEVGGVSSTEKAHGKTVWQIAIIPLCLYMGSTGTSFFIKKLEEKVPRKMLFVIGVGFTVVAGVPMFFLRPALWFLMLPLAVVYGIGFSFALNISTSFIAAFIGGRGKSAAFVWGYICLFEKFSSGIALFLLANIGSLNNQEYVRLAVAGVPLFTLIVGGILQLLLKNTEEFSLKTRKVLPEVIDT